METLTLSATKKISPQVQQPVPVLHIIKSLGRGGAEMLLSETLNKHNKEKYQFHYIYFLPWKDQMVHAIENAGGRVTCFPASNNFQIIGQVNKLAAYVKKHHIKLIHCHLPWAGITGRLVGKLTKVPVVYTEHNTWEQYHKITYFINRLSFSNQQKVIAVSKNVARSIERHYSKKHPQIQIVANGINTEKFSRSSSAGRDIRRELNISPTSIVIGIVCVFRREKRMDVWLEVAKNLHDKFPNITFIVVGDGDLRNEIHTAAKRLQIEEHVHFVGLQTEIRPYLQAMNIFMMTSEFEGLPLALLEAMSMECVPACTSAGGIVDVIEDNQNGIIVPVQEPMQLVARLSEVLQNPARMDELAKAARKTVIENYSVQTMVSQLEDIYDNLLTEKR